MIIHQQKELYYWNSTELFRFPKSLKGWGLQWRKNTTFKMKRYHMEYNWLIAHSTNLADSIFLSYSKGFLCIRNAIRICTKPKHHMQKAPKCVYIYIATYFHHICYKKLVCLILTTLPSTIIILPICRYNNGMKGVKAF